MSLQVFFNSSATLHCWPTCRAVQLLTIRFLDQPLPKEGSRAAAAEG